MRLILLTLSFVLSLVLSLPTTPKAPSEDDFYIAPDDIENYKLGDIIRYRNTPAQLRGIIFPINIKNSWQLLIRSEDSFGNPNAFVSTIMEPYDADPNKVISYQTFEDSTNLDCSASYGFLYGASMSTFNTQIDMTLITLALQKGYYVVSPDYEGFKSTWTVGRQSGYATLNSIRATLKSGNLTGINSDAKVAMWGYSGGSLASGWANVFLNSYAPEIEDKVIGTALGGFFTNVTAMFEVVDGGIAAGLTPIALTGLTNEYPNITDLLYQNVGPNQRVNIEDAKNHCLIGSLIKYFDANIFSGNNPSIPGGFEVLKIPAINQVIQENCLLNLDVSKYKPTTPVFIYQGTLDQILPIKDSKKAYQQWCDAGVSSVEFAEDLLNGHITEYLVGAPAAWTWIENRFAGIPPVKGCSHTVRAENLFYPNVSKATYDYFEGLIDAFSFAKIGYQGLSSDNVSNSDFQDFLTSIENYFN
ncbi:hypothetical protein KGF54_000600 [Candida jiufengensis]|uniref:uncharacterized protein n=1 Tax=Candida jiufengensis TaxID=497108 RepID=UPI0022247928|nr:uncharacterized protein KGF54_000600 [Candida jiufengensis]KAI5956981.1 hypothetical protein KGF54_000600 [Candida jiufengensis]